jgi:hypothetical protein
MQPNNRKRRRAIMGIERGYWPPSHIRGVMLTKIGDGVRDYYGIPGEPLPTRLVELLKLLDEDAIDTRTRRSGPRPSG